MSNQPTHIIGSITVGGHTGITGTTGLQGTSGPVGYMIDWKDELMKKYTRFTIKTEYDVMTPHDGKPFTPTNIITDKRTNKEYTFKPHSVTNIVNQTEQFIQQLITIIRDEKINTIFNEPKD